MISIIIPVYNEEANIKKLLAYLHQHNNGIINEIIVSDGGSTDATFSVAAAAGAVVVASPEIGRAAQMNYGARLATGAVLYFIHADTFPHPSFFDDIKKAVEEEFEFGRYRTKFDSKKKILGFNAFFTRFDMFVCYGGDQTFFITKKIFEAIGGFNESMLIMEDYEIVQRAKKMGRYKIIQKNVLVSARKYDTNSWLKVQRANYTIVQLYKKGATQQEMVTRYKELLHYRQ
ncbi:MAG: TIGR04283 family arsenosugar biosynthesis glycosyltransferase [Ferruginibacter sp.]